MPPVPGEAGTPHPIFYELSERDECAIQFAPVATYADFVLDVRDHTHLLRASELLTVAMGGTVSIGALHKLSQTPGCG